MYCMCKRQRDEKYWEGRMRREINENQICESLLLIIQKKVKQVNEYFIWRVGGKRGEEGGKKSGEDIIG